MVLKRVRFTFVHDDCWLLETTERHEAVTLVVSSIYMDEGEVHVNVTVHAPDPDTVDTIEDEWEADPRVRDLTRLYSDPQGTRFHARYGSEPSIYPHVRNHTPVSFGTVRMAQGTEYFNIVGDPDDIQDLLETLNEEGTAKLQAAEDVEEFPDDDGGPGLDLEGLLTDRQLQVLVLALTEGFYEWPRELTASDLAGNIDLDVSTFLEHLRKAEGRLARSYVEALREGNPARYEAARGVLRDELED